MSILRTVSIRENWNKKRINLSGAKYICLVPLHAEQPDRDGLATTLNFGVFFVGNHLNGLPQIYEKRYSHVNTMCYIVGG